MRIRRCLVFVALVVFAACGESSTSQLTPAPQPADRRASLNGTWKFRADPDDTGLAAQWFAEDVQTDAWTDITVPANWNFLYRNTAYPDTDHDYDGIGWYRTTFTLPVTAVVGRLVRLHFGAVSYKSTVWLNGKQVGEHEGDFLPFELDVTDTLRTDRPNTIAVRVESLNADSVNTVPPAAERYDYWIYSGIYRDVYLELTNPVNIYDVFFHAEPTADGMATVSAQVQLLNTGATAATVTVRTSVHDGSIVSSLPETVAVIPPRAFVTVNLGGLLAHPRLWSPATPETYEGVVEITSASGGHLAAAAVPQPYDAAAELPPHATLVPRPLGAALDAVQVTFGVRKIETAGRQILLNGAPLIFHGVNRHDEYPLLGRTLPDRIYEDDLAQMKSAGVNAIRTAHYPNDPRIYDLADRLGFLVFEEVPCTALNATEMQIPKVQELARAQTRAMVYRDRNHPSIVIWSAGNEPTPAGRSDFNAGLYAEMKAADPTRLVTYARVLFDNKTPDAASDIVSLNPYYGWYLGAVADLDAYLEKTHRLFPDKPIILSEFGADAIKDERTNSDPATSPQFSEDYQAYLLSETWRIVRSKEYISGGFIWVFADFLSPTRQYLKSSSTPPNVVNPVPYHNLKGLVTNERVPKNAYLTALGMFREGTSHTLTIQTTDAAGSLLTGTTVDLYLTDGTWCGHQTTGDDGHVVFWFIPPLDYSVRASHGSLQASRQINVSADESVILALTP